MAGVDILASAFSGANAAFLGEQMLGGRRTRFCRSNFAELFAALNDDARAVLEEATGASWAPRRPGEDEEAAVRIAAGRNLVLQSGEQVRAATIASPCAR